MTARQRMVVYLPVLLMLAVPSFAQFTFTKLFNNVTTTGPSGVANFVGQQNHTLFVQFSGAGCVAPAPNIGMEASFDGTNFFRIGGTIAGVGAGVSVPGITNAVIASTQGTYPYVRANARAFDTVNCTLNGWYGGTPYTATAPNNTSGNNAAGTLRSPMLSSTAIGNTTVLAAITGLRIVCYAIDIWNPGGANTITLQGSVVQSALVNLNSFPANSGWTAAFTGNRQLQTSDSEALQLTTSAATRVDAWFKCQYE